MATSTMWPPARGQAGWPHGHPVATPAPTPLPGWRAGSKPTRDLKFGATALRLGVTALSTGLVGVLLLTEVDATVLRLDALNDEGGVGGALGLEDAILFRFQHLELQVLGLPEPRHVAPTLQVARDCHHGAPFLGYETWVLPDPGASASCGRKAGIEIPLRVSLTASPPRAPPWGPHTPPLAQPLGLALLLRVWDNQEAGLWGNRAT